MKTPIATPFSISATVARWARSGGARPKPSRRPWRQAPGAAKPAAC